MLYLGDFPTGQTIYIPFQTFDSNDPTASVTMSGLATTDIEIYKNGVATTRSSENGYTLLDTDGIDFDGITGIHGISIDTSDNSDAGFFAAGNDYWVIVSSITVDGGTINFVAAIFSIDNRGLLRPTTAQRTLDVAATGEAGLDFDNIKDATGAHTLTNITVPAVTESGLADDAITSAKYDESSAFPVAASDAGATQIARVGADSDTLETLSDQLDLQATLAICTEARLAELDAGNLPTDIADIPTVAEFNARTLVAASYFDPAADTVALVTDITTKAGFSLSSAGIDAIWDQAASISLSFEVLLERVYQMLSNKETVVDANGNVALRDIGDSNDIATGNIADDDTTTTRAEFSWV